MNSKIEAGSSFPTIQVNSLDGTTVDLGARPDDMDWLMVVVYRGKHCPLCTRYLNLLEGYQEQLKDLRVGLVAVSADSKVQLEGQLEKLEVSFPIYYGLSVEQMQRLGVYISHPRSPQETDHPFAEPGLFVIDEQGQVQVVDLSNNPFVRPDLDQLVSGLAWIRNPDNNYPIRGTFPYS